MAAAPVITLPFIKIYLNTVIVNPDSLSNYFLVTVVAFLPPFSNSCKGTGFYWINFRHSFGLVFPQFQTFLNRMCHVFCPELSMQDYL